MLRKWSMLVSLLCILPALVFAQNTGKIAGVVTDRGTGDPLIGANVRIEGTSLGQATKLDGSYFIIGVPVGTYKVTVSYTGYTALSKENVSVSTGYTTTLDFSLVEGIETEELEVVGRPLIQKDAIGDPKIVSAEQLSNLPVRGVGAVLNVQGGIAADDRGNSYARGGRDEEIVYYIDGVRTVGSLALPQASIQEQEMLIGNISPRYGDVMSGVVNITTKAGQAKYFGSVEALSSQFLDPYEYNLAEATVGGPIVKNKVSFFVGASYLSMLDENPSWGSFYRLPQARVDQLVTNPQGYAVRDANNNVVLSNGFPVTTFLPTTNAVTTTRTGVRDATTGVVSVNSTTTTGSYILLDANGNMERNAAGNIVIRNSGALSATTGIAGTLGTTSSQSVAIGSPQHGAELINPTEYEETRASQRPYDRLALNGNLSFNLDKMLIKVGARTVNSNRTGSGVGFMNFGSWTNNDFGQFSYFTTLNHRLSSATFYQLTFSNENRRAENYNNLIGIDNGLEDLLRYGDVNDPANVAVTRYRNVASSRVDTNGDGTTDTNALVFTNPYIDGNWPTTTTEFYNYPNVIGNFYEKGENKDTNLNGFVQTQAGIHQLEIGAEYRKTVNRYWGISPRRLAGFYRDCPEYSTVGYCASAERQVGKPGDAGYWDQSLGSWSDVTFFHLSPIVEYYYGYSFDGTKTVDSQDINAFAAGAAVTGNANRTQDKAAFNVAPWSPVYMGGYIQDKIEYKDLVVSLGLRLDVFDNNTQVLKDEYALVNIERAGSPMKLTSAGSPLTISNRPSNIADDFAVYRNSSNAVVGYRDLDGYFYNATGTRLPLATGFDQIKGLGTANAVDANGVKTSKKEVSASAFTDYEPQVTLMPRIGVSFPVTDKALFFARYGVVSQRPGQNTFISLMGYYDVVADGATARISNPNLKPPKTIEYELGYRQSLSDKQAVTVSGFIRQMKDLIALRDNNQTFPVGYTTYKNVDFGYVKGIEARYDMRRTNGLALNVNYTLSYAEGTGSDASTLATIAWLSGFYPNFVSRLDFDQRHKLNALADYRFGNDAPNFLQGVGLNLIYSFGTGFPYTGRLKADYFGSTSSRTVQPESAINNRELPATQRFDLRVDKDFKVNGNRLTAYVMVNNLLNTRNIRFVHPFTALPDEDGYLSDPRGLGQISNYQNSGNYAWEQQYRNAINGRDNYGVPRQIRLGIRFNFD